MYLRPEEYRRWREQKDRRDARRRHLLVALQVVVYCVAAIVLGILVYGALLNVAATP